MKLSVKSNLLRLLPFVAVAALLITGCGGGNSFSTNVGYLRIMHASANAPNVDVLLDGHGLAANLAFTSVTSLPLNCANVPSGTPCSGTTTYQTVANTSHNLGVYVAGTQFGVPVFPSASVATPKGSYTTVFAINDLLTVAPLVVTDNNSVPAANTANLRLIHLAPDVPGVDAEVDAYVTAPGYDLTTAPALVVDGINIFAIAGQIPYAGIDPTKGVTAYINLPASAAGTKYDLQIFPTGVIGQPKTAAIYVPSFTLKSLQVRTGVALDQAFPVAGKPNGKFQAVLLADLD